MVWAAKYEVAPVPRRAVDRIDLDQVEAHFPGAVGQGDEGLFELAVRHAVRLGGDASAYERRVQDVNVQADIPTRGQSAIPARRESPRGLGHRGPPCRPRPRLRAPSTRQRRKVGMPVNGVSHRQCVCPT